MTKHGKGNDKLSVSGPANLKTVLHDAQETYGLIKQAAVKGKSGKKQDHTELLGALAKTTKGMVELAIDQRKRYVAKKQDKALLKGHDREVSAKGSGVPGGSACDALTFQARFELQGKPQSVAIDTGAPCTVIDQRFLKSVVQDARLEKLERPLELYVDGMTVSTTAKALFDLEVAGKTADIRLACTAFVVERLRTPRLMLSTDMLELYGIDLLISRMYMRINACEGELVPLC